MFRMNWAVSWTAAGRRLPPGFPTPQPWSRVCAAPTCAPRKGVMKGIPTSAGSASRCENEFWAGGGHAKASGVPGRCWDLENYRMLAVAREGVLSPLRGWFSWGDETQRSRAGLPSDGPPGLGPRLCRARGCLGVSGSDRVFPCDFSIPMPIPIPIPTRGARVCRAGSSSAGGVSVRQLRRLGKVSCCDLL